MRGYKCGAAVHHLVRQGVKIPFFVGLRLRRFSIKSEVASISGIPYKRKDEITPQGTLRRFSESSFDAQKSAGTNISGVPNDEGTGSNEVPDEKQRGQL